MSIFYFAGSRIRDSSDDFQKFWISSRATQNGLRPLQILLHMMSFRLVSAFSLFGLIRRVQATLYLCFETSNKMKRARRKCLMKSQFVLFCSFQKNKRTEEEGDIFKIINFLENKTFFLSFPIFFLLGVGHEKITLKNIRISIFVFILRQV